MVDKQVYRELAEVTAEGLQNVKRNFQWVAERVKVIFVYIVKYPYMPSFLHAVSVVYVLGSLVCAIRGTYPGAGVFVIVPAYPQL